MCRSTLGKLQAQLPELLTVLCVILCLSPSLHFPILSLRRPGPKLSIHGQTFIPLRPLCTQTTVTTRPTKRTAEPWMWTQNTQPRAWLHWVSMVKLWPLTRSIFPFLETRNSWVTLAISSAQAYDTDGSKNETPRYFLSEAVPCEQSGSAVYGTACLGMWNWEVHRWMAQDGGDQNHGHERAMRWSKNAFERDDREIAHSVLFPCLLGPQPFCTHAWGGAESKGSCFA